MTWSLNRKCRTRGNLPIGNLWLVGRSHTYLLWWIMGSPQDSCLTCQVSEDTCDVNSVCLQYNSRVYFSQVQRGNICRIRTAARLSRHQLSAQVYVWYRSFSSITGSTTTCNVMKLVHGGGSSCVRKLWVSHYLPSTATLCIGGEHHSKKISFCK